MNIDALIGGGALGLAVPLAVLAGLVSFLSPCVLPLVPGYLGYLSGAVAPRVPAAPPAPGAGSTVLAAAPTVPAVSRARLVGGVLLFIAGFTAVFLALNILGATFGRLLLPIADVTTRVLGVVVIALGLIFIGAFGVAQRTVRVRFEGTAGLIGAPLLGVALGFGWTPCIGPTLAAITAVSWNLGDPARAAVLGLAYSAGLGIPFVLLALGLGWAARSVAVVRRHIRAVNIAGGVLLVVLGVLMATGVWGAIMSQLQGVFASVPLPL